MTDTASLPIEADDTLIQGATFRRSWRWTRDGVPVDLTGWQGRMQVRRTFAAPDTMLSLTTENGGVLLGSDGTVALYASDAQTSAVPASGRYDIELVDPDGDVVRWRMGRMSLSLEVTR